MNHYISICTSRGAKADKARMVDLDKVFNLLTLPKNASPTKDNSVLIFNGYNESQLEYHRRENELTNFSTVFLDVDNPNKDKDIISKFQKEYKEYDYYLYETFSSTPDCPKFRVIIPLSEILPWTKSAKKAIFRIFHKYADEKASWFYAPTRNKLQTVYHNTGKLFPVYIIQRKIKWFDELEQMRAFNYRLDNFDKKSKPNSPNSWRNLPSVKKCLDCLVEGERDSSINKACFAMDKHGYRESIRDFLDEVFVPNDIKDKFYRKYSN